MSGRFVTIYVDQNERGNDSSLFSSWWGNQLQSSTPSTWPTTGGDERVFFWTVAIISMKTLAMVRWLWWWGFFSYENVCSIKNTHTNINSNNDCPGDSFCSSQSSPQPPDLPFTGAGVKFTHKNKMTIVDDWENKWMQCCSCIIFSSTADPRLL